MDELNSRFRSAFDTLMQQQPDPPVFEELDVPALDDSPRAGRRRPLVAFGAGLALVSAFGLILWLGGAWSDRLPPPLEIAETTELGWQEAPGIDPGFQQIHFATGPDRSLAVATSRSQGDGISVEGIYRSETGIGWEKVDSTGLQGLDQLVWLTSFRDGYLASGSHEDDDTSRPAVWQTEDGGKWDLTLLPLPEQDPDAIVSYGVGQVALHSHGGIALGQFVVNRPGETGPESDAGPQFDEEGNPLPPGQGIFVWETDARGEWAVSDTAPASPLSLSNGPAGPILLTTEADSIGVWQRDRQSWSQVATLPIRADFLEAVIVGNETGYLVVFQNGDTWFSSDAIQWAPSDDLTETPGLVVAGPGGFMVTSTVGLPVSWSNNGTEWRRLSLEDDLGVDNVNALIAAGVNERAINLAVSTGSGDSIRRFVITGTLTP